MLKSEKGMTKVELVVGIVVVILVVGFSIFLTIGEPRSIADNNAPTVVNKTDTDVNNENQENTINPENQENNTDDQQNNEEN